MRLFVMIVAVCVLGSVAYGQSKSPATDAAVARRDQVVAQAQAAKDAAVAAANKALIEALDAEIKSAMAAGDLERAKHADDAKQSAITNNGPTPATPDTKSVTVDQIDKFARGEVYAPQGKVIIFAIDTRGVGQLKHLDAMRGQVRLAMKRMTPGQSFNVVGFGSNADGAFAFPAPVPAGKASLAAADKFMGKLGLMGSEYLGPAMKRVADQKPDEMWLITTGRFGQLSPGDVSKAVSFAGCRVITTQAVSLPEDQPGMANREKLLNFNLANDFGGKCLDPDGRPILPTDPLKPGGSKVFSDPAK